MDRVQSLRFPSVSLFLKYIVSCARNDHLIWKTLTQAQSKIGRRQSEALGRLSLRGCSGEKRFLLQDGVVNVVYHCVKYISKIIFTPSCKV